MPFEHILSSLPQLSPEELAIVRERVMALSSLDGVRVEDDWLLQGIIAVLGDLGLDDTVPLNFRITNRRQFHGYLPKSEKVRAVAERGISNATKLDRLALGRLLAKCLAAKIQDFRVVSLNAMLQHVELALSALDECFPGYLQSGLLRILIRKEFPKIEVGHQRTYPRAAG